MSSSAFIISLHGFLTDLKTHLNIRKPTHPVSLYTAVIEKAVDEKIENKIRETFLDFFTKNPEYADGVFATKDIRWPGKSDKIYIPIREIYEALSVDHKEVLISHLVSINAIIDPSEDNLALLASVSSTQKKNFADYFREKIDITTTEGSYISSILGKVSAILDKIPEGSSMIAVGGMLFGNPVLRGIFEEAKNKIASGEFTVQGFMKTFGLDDEFLQEVQNATTEITATQDYQGGVQRITTNPKFKEVIDKFVPPDSNIDIESAVTGLSGFIPMAMSYINAQKPK